MQSALSAARVLDGIAIAAEIKSEVARDVELARRSGYTPGLAVVLVGDNAASQIYVRSKIKTCGELGIRSEMHTPPASITTEELLAIVHSLNSRDDVDGILIQLPLPDHVDTSLLLEAVDPRKDVDGFHPINAGRLLSGAAMDTVLAPCTPAGIMEILKRSNIPIAGADAVVVGRSNIVGKPIASMLINASATVTVCHSRTRDLPKITREADILVAAIGRAGFVHRDMVRPGATIVDVGINRLTGEAEFSRFFPPDHPDHIIRRQGFEKRGSTVIGDVDPAAFAVSGAYTPVPGGVGALTIAMLMSNTAKAARLRRNLPAPRH
ncbi:MAG TPA: bifunctional 5,10-methylenetetrahydrofolate dehydrogenase/5,10-methenyltetrahydrofolate cyclohydrolase [Acidobacteriaceae bacterium]|nr:bifunctional 5,10-methylenetetrahydrofolate dehydrogenase/5,10-methenyltetrahydrofolate cyclohydrolase [Acidobacteriaceae bacterium]